MDFSSWSTLTMKLPASVFVDAARIGVALSPRTSIWLCFIVGGMFAPSVASDKLPRCTGDGAREVSPTRPRSSTGSSSGCASRPNLPKPRVAVARARCRTPLRLVGAEGPTVCVTTGIMDRLEPPELQGVMAHELGMSQNRDVTVMTIASSFGHRWPRPRSSASPSARCSAVGTTAATARTAPPRAPPAILVSVPVYAISFLLPAGLSRYREFAADRGVGDHHRRAERARLGADQDSSAMMRSPT